MHKISR